MTSLAGLSIMVGGLTLCVVGFYAASGYNRQQTDDVSKHATERCYGGGACSKTNSDTEVCGVLWIAVDTVSPSKI